jgi:hypothetical protein
MGPLTQMQLLLVGEGKGTNGQGPVTYSNLLPGSEALLSFSTLILLLIFFLPHSTICNYFIN